MISSRGDGGLVVRSTRRGGGESVVRSTTCGFFVRSTTQIFFLGGSPGPRNVRVSSAELGKDSRRCFFTRRGQGVMYEDTIRGRGHCDCVAGSAEDGDGEGDRLGLDWDNSVVSFGFGDGGSRGDAKLLGLEVSRGGDIRGASSARE